MAKVNEFIDWMLKNKEEFHKEKVKSLFVLTEENWQGILKILIEKKFILEPNTDTYIITENALAMPNYTIDTLKPLLKEFFSGRDNTAAEIGRIGWDTLKQIDKFKVFPGEEKIYEICLKGKVIKMEGKEIMDFEIFILRLFETFGIMLPKYRTLGNDWAQLVSFWMQTYGEVVESQQENISAGTEAVDTVIGYINHAVISDDYIVKDGFITYKNGMLYVPTKCIKKLLKREDLFVSLRKLAYLMKDYLISGSIPLKIENKSERFWKLNPKKFDIKLESEIKLEKEPDEIDESKPADVSSTPTIAMPEAKASIEVQQAISPEPVQIKEKDTDFNSEDEEG